MYSDVFCRVSKPFNQATSSEATQTSAYESLDAETRDQIGPKSESPYESPRPVVDMGIPINQPVNRDSGYMSPIPLMDRNGSGNSQNGQSYENVRASVQNENDTDDYKIPENSANAQHYEDVEIAAN